MQPLGHLQFPDPLREPRGSFSVSVLKGLLVGAVSFFFDLHFFDLCVGVAIPDLIDCDPDGLI
jgi:hypothetical protein